MASLHDSAAQLVSPSKSVPRDLVPLRVAKTQLGLCANSIRALADNGAIDCYRIGGLNGAHSHCRFSLANLRAYAEGYGASSESAVERVLLYARVSTNSQSTDRKKVKDGCSDLSRQIERLRAYAAEHFEGIDVVLFQDTGSGMNFEKPGLTALIDSILSGQFDGAKLLIENKDRCLRWGFELIAQICRAHRVEIVITEQDENSTDEAMLAADLMAVIHCFSTRHYGLRAAERKRKILSEATLQRGKELLEKGLSVETITKRLRSEGHVCEDGASISTRSVRKYIYLQFNQLQQVWGEETKTSAQEFYAEFAERCDDLVRLRAGQAFDHYKTWCAKNKKEIVEKRRFTAVFNRHHGAVTWKNSRAWKGVRLKGLELHEQSEPYKGKISHDSPIESLLGFLEPLRGTRIRTNELWANYKAFCLNENVEPLKRHTMGRILVRMGARKRMGTQGWFYELDRIDIHIEVAAVPFKELAHGPCGTDTAIMREQVERARAVQTQRFGGATKQTNGQMTSRQVRQVCQLDAASRDLLESSVNEAGLSARAHDKILRVARTIADVDGDADIRQEHVGEAVNYRMLDRRFWA